MKQFLNPLVISLVLISVVDSHVKCLPSSKPSSDSSTGSTSSAGSQSSKGSKTDGSDLWSPQPEYYKPDRTDFATASYHDGFKNKYGGSYSLPSLSSYGNNDRLGGYKPLSADHKDAYYNSGDVFNLKKPFHGPVNPTYGHDYDNHYANKPYNHAFSLDHSSSEKDFFKSVLVPLAGVALLGFAIALVVNPGLLQLGSMALAGLAGKRKRRDVTVNAHNLAYRGYLKQVLEAPPSAKSL